MCIRDRNDGVADLAADDFSEDHHRISAGLRARGDGLAPGCLLYTSDAADERSSVDLGGRRIIKKKTYDRPA